VRAEIVVADHRNTQNRTVLEHGTFGVPQAFGLRQQTSIASAYARARLRSAQSPVFGASPLDHFLGLDRTSMLVRHPAFVIVFLAARFALQPTAAPAYGGEPFVNKLPWAQKN